LDAEWSSGIGTVRANYENSIHRNNKKAAECFSAASSAICRTIISYLALV
jgi:hypothetical protein